jgi:hypothetical protein
MKVIPNDEIDKQITKCLAGSVDRDGGREERRRKKLIFGKCVLLINNDGMNLRYFPI